MSGATAAAPYGAKLYNLITTNSSLLGGQSVLTFSNYSQDSGYDIRHFLPSLAIAYDW